MQAHVLENNNMSTNFDTLQYAKRAQQAGFTLQQAEFQAEEMAKVIDNHIATKEDVNELSRVTTQGFKEVRIEIEMLRLEMKALENRLIIKMGGMLVVAIGVLTTILKLT